MIDHRIMGEGSTVLSSKPARFCLFNGQKKGFFFWRFELLHTLVHIVLVRVYSPAQRETSVSAAGTVDRLCSYRVSRQ
jgi:hypothetical protein